MGQFDVRQDAAALISAHHLQDVPAITMIVSPYFEQSTQGGNALLGLLMRVVAEADSALTLVAKHQSMTFGQLMMLAEARASWRADPS